MQFSDLGLSPEVLKAVEDAGYTQPTPIQRQAIPHILMGRDVLGTAQTGTGKTAGFTLPMIDILAAGIAKARMPRSLILEPTRELADQVSKSFETYGKYHKLSMALLIGGVSFGDQDKKLDRGVDVLIATPGRLLDHVERGRVMLTGVKVLVIDEADRMLDMGFIPDVERIVSHLPPLRQTLFFSATMSAEMRRLADAFLSNPKEVAVAPPASPAAANVQQGLVVVDREDKREALRRLIKVENVRNAIIFCNRKRDVDILAKSLSKHGFDAAALHGDMSQSSRTETLEKFKAGTLSLLVASDVAARGLDVQGLSHVFNFDVPMHAEDYVHRIGRTGRAGQSGRALTLATPDDGKYIAAITSLIGRDIPAITVEGLDTASLSSGEHRRRSRGGGTAKRAGKPPTSGASASSEGRQPRVAKDVSDGSAAEPAPERVRRQRTSKPPAARDPAAREPAAHEPAARETPRPPAAEKIRPAETDRPPRRSEGRRSRKDDDLGPPVVGMGDHMPAFLTRPARPKR